MATKKKTVPPQNHEYVHGVCVLCKRVRAETSTSSPCPGYVTAADINPDSMRNRRQPKSIKVTIKGRKK